jgi:ABC-type molybdate transport system substrate-binding protein
VFRRRFLILLLFLAAPDSFAQENSTLKIAAAADLQPVLPALIDQFEKQTE